MYTTLKELLETTIKYNKYNKCISNCQENIEIYFQVDNEKICRMVFPSNPEIDKEERTIYNIAKMIYSRCEELGKTYKKNLLDHEVVKVETYVENYDGEIYKTLILREHFDIEEWTDKYYEMYLNDDNVFSSQDLLKETTYVCHKKTGKLGKSKCHSVKDYFDSELGYAIAYARAIGDEVPQEILTGDC